MRLLNNLEYEKKEPFRDHRLFVIICEGEKREVDYFRFFDRLTSNIKVHAYPPIDSRSSPNHILKNAQLKFDKYEPEEVDELWIVLDTDHHQDLIHDVAKVCSENENWHIAISNPCFEVWLFYHFREDNDGNLFTDCANWKRKISRIQAGGFNSNFHPTLLRDANKNARRNSEFDGYIPKAGSTSLFELGENIYELVKSVLKEYY